MKAQEKNSDIDEIFTSMSQTVNNIKNFLDLLLSRGKCSLKALSEEISAEIDEVIEKEIRNGNKYLAGRFTVTLIGNKNFKAAFEIYLEQPNGEFLKIDGDSQIFPLSRLESSDADELLLKKEIVHEFDEPQQSFSDARIVNESASSSNEISLTELLQGHH